MYPEKQSINNNKKPLALLKIQSPPPPPPLFFSPPKKKDKEKIKKNLIIEHRLSKASNYFCPTLLQTRLFCVSFLHPSQQQAAAGDACRTLVFLSLPWPVAFSSHKVLESSGPSCEQLLLLMLLDWLLSHLSIHVGGSSNSAST